MSVSSLLARTRDVMESTALHKGDYFKYDGDELAGCCIQGAMVLAQEPEFHSPRYALLRSVETFLHMRDALDARVHLGRAIEGRGRPYLSIVKFNDDPNTTKADVLSVIDSAMQRVERS